MPVSPVTQSMMQPPPSEEDATLAFQEGFSQMAHRTLSSKFPELVDSVNTFKILKTSLPTNSGVGAFIVDLEGRPVFIPVVLSNNQIKPMDIMYIQDKDIFLPLSPAWITEVARGEIDNLGSPVKMPRTLSSDTDISQVVVPPDSGMNAYASGKPSGIKLAHFLSTAPNETKEAFKKVLESNPNILKYAFENFDKDMLLESMKFETVKTASAYDGVDILTPNSSVEDFRKIFNKNAGVAYQESVKKGYVVSDNRETSNKPIDTSMQITLVEPREAGFYWISLKDGTRKRALVVPTPQAFKSPVLAGKRTDMDVHTDPFHARRNANDEQQRFLTVFENGRISVLHDAPLGEWIPNEEVPESFMSKLTTGTTPKGHGVFVCSRDGKFRATLPTRIFQVSTGPDGVRRMTTEGRTLVTDPKSKIKQIVAPTDSNVTYIPENYVFVARGDDVSDQDWRGDEEPVKEASTTKAHEENLERVGSVKEKLIYTGTGFSLSGREEMDKVATVTVLTKGVGLRANAAEELMEKAASDGVTSFYVVNDTQFSRFVALTKIAQGIPPTAPIAPQDPAQDPAAAAPQDPAAGAPPPEGLAPPMMDPAMMDPAMMAPPMPPPPDPIALAVDEIGAQVMQQASTVSMQLAEAQKDLSEKLDVLQAVKARAAQIAVEMGGGQDPSMMGQDPGMMGQGMPQDQGMQQGGANSIVPQMPSLMPPEQPMPEQGPTSMEMANSAAPGMEQGAQLAQKLEDPSIFEATAIGNLSDNTNLRDVVVDYMPVLEDALDKLGRTLFVMWLEEDKVREELGEEDYIDLEKRILTVFDNLGDVILRINRTALPSGEDETLDA